MVVLVAGGMPGPGLRAPLGGQFFPLAQESQKALASISPGDTPPALIADRDPEEGWQVQLFISFRGSLWFQPYTNSDTVPKCGTSVPRVQHAH